MASIGNFTRSGDGFIGPVRMLSITQGVAGCVIC